jgi:hypothetical protein
VLAVECRSYSELLNCIRRRKDELNVSFEILDAVSGLQSGYSAKLLSPRPVKRLGEVSLAALLGALGLRLVIEPDDAALAKVRRRLTPRQTSPTNRVRTGATDEATGESGVAAAI